MKKLPAVGEKRYVALVQVKRSVNEAERTIEFVASDESVDRYGDVIRQKGWDTRNYERNPVFLWAHRSTEPPIGKTIELRIETNPPALVHVVQFAKKETYPFADTIFNLYKDDIMNAVSVGFRPTQKPQPIRDSETDQITGFEFVKQELMELSAVPLPANPNALARAAEGGHYSKDDMEVIMRCGDKNPAWANMVPGVTYPESEVVVQIPQNQDAKEPTLRQEIDSKKIRATVAEVMDKLIETNKHVDSLNSTTVKKAELGETMNRIDEVKSNVRGLMLAIRELSGVLATKDEVENLVPDFERLILKLDKVNQNAAKESTLSDMGAAVQQLTRQLEKALSGILRKNDLQDLASKVEANRTATASLEDSVAKAADIRRFQESVGEVRTRVIEIGRTVDSDVAKTIALEPMIGGIDSLRERTDELRTMLDAAAGTANSQAALLSNVASATETLRERFDILRDGAASGEDVRQLTERVSDLRFAIDKVSSTVATKADLQDIIERIENGCKRIDNLSDHVAHVESSIKERAMEQIEERRTVCPYTDDAIADKGTAWDAGAEMAKQSSPQGWKHMSTVINGDPALKGSYKLPHHSGTGFKVIPNGVRAALGRVEQTQMSSSDRPGARAHLARHQKKIAAMKGFDFDAEAFERHLEELGRVYRAAEDQGDETERVAADSMIRRYVDKMCTIEEPKVAEKIATPDSNPVNRFLSSIRKAKPETEPDQNDPNEPDEPYEGSCTSPDCKCDGFISKKAAGGDPKDPCQRSGCGHPQSMHVGK